MTEVKINHEILKEFCIAALESRNVRNDVIDHVKTSLIQTSLRGVDSHGIELLPHYIRAIDAGRINPQPNYKYEMTATGTGKFDGDHTFGHAGGGEAMKNAIALAEKNGIGAVSVHNSTHFGAAAYFALLASSQDFIGLSFTHADALMLSYGGTRPYFGTNPICFSAPCANEEPFCLDMATSLVSWNKILRYRNSNQEIPSEWACDDNGDVSSDPHQVASLLPIGGYKGFGLSMMIDILCGILAGMPFGRDISRMYGDPIEQKRFLGHFFIAIKIESFLPLEIFKQQLQKMMDSVRNEPNKNPDISIMVAGDPEKRTYETRMKDGIPISETGYNNFQKIAQEINFNLT